jgi:3-phenylpropionate/trans-cinnamate dioxygenase ferredoxin subunit
LRPCSFASFARNQTTNNKQKIFDSGKFQRQTPNAKPQTINNKHFYMSWHKIAETNTDLFVDGNPIVEIDLGEKKVCIIKWKDEIKACAEKCPHAGAKMVDGYLDALGNIVCPLHKYKFNLEKGRNVTGEGYFLKTYMVEQRADGIYINL